MDTLTKSPRSTVSVSDGMGRMGFQHELVGVNVHVSLVAVPVHSEYR